jgi:Sodium:neurotransmitter symporter family
VYGVDRFCKDIEFMLDRKTGLYWRFCWKYITPSIMIGILGYFIATWQPITYQGYEYSDRLHTFGWFLSMLGLAQLPIWTTVAIFKQRKNSLIQRIVSAFKPSPNWGPSDSDTSEYPRNRFLWPDSDILSSSSRVTLPRVYRLLGATRTQMNPIDDLLLGYFRIAISIINSNVMSSAYHRLGSSF